jgi:hypothetical protein
MNFFQYSKSIRYEDYRHLNRLLERRYPLKAMHDPNFLNTVRVNALCGYQLESLRDRKHVVQQGLAERKHFVRVVESTGDRRSFDRYPLAGVEVVLVTGEKKILDVQPGDVSFGGLSVTVPREVDLAPGRHVGVSLKYGEEQELLAIGLVANVRDDRTRQKIGIQFDQNRIGESLDQLKDLILFCIEEAERERKSRIAAA